MAAFFKLPLETVREMDVQDIHYADMAVRQLDAQEKIVLAKIALLPNMKQQAIDKFMKALHKEAYPERSKKKRALTEKDLLEMMNVRR